MALSVAIAGLPNAGKSTLFNALTRASAAVGSYPFTTVEPNTGVVPVADKRLDALAHIFKPPRVVPATVTFTDIAGLVRGASQGEGLGNRFLGHIRDCDAIVLVTRGFSDADVVHIEGGVDPVRDIDLVEIELQLADLDTVSRRLERVEKVAQQGGDEERRFVATLQRVRAHLDSSKPVRTLSLDPEEQARLRELFLLTAKPLLVVVNVDEGGDTAALDTVQTRAAQSGGDALALSARIEAEIAELEPQDQEEFLQSLGLYERGLQRLTRAAYRLLDLITFFTAGEREVHAWTLRRGMTAIDAAGAIHTDFARGFIRAEVIDADALIAAGSTVAAREQGRQRLEGKDYLVKDGDVMYFRFNV